MASRPCPRAQEIVALHDLGMDGPWAVLLLDHFGDLDAVFTTDHEQLIEIPGVRSATAKRVFDAAEARRPA